VFALEVVEGRTRLLSIAEGTDVGRQMGSSPGYHGSPVFHSKTHSAAFFVNVPSCCERAANCAAIASRDPGFPASRAEVDSEVSGLTLIPDVEPACTPFEEAPAACLRSLKAPTQASEGQDVQQGRQQMRVHQASF